MLGGFESGLLLQLTLITDSLTHLAILHLLALVVTVMVMVMGCDDDR